jgi:hypothetical protein
MPIWPGAEWQFSGDRKRKRSFDGTSQTAEFHPLQIFELTHYPAVFILGAGASWHYGYPTGEETVKKKPHCRYDDTDLMHLMPVLCRAEAIR